MKTASAGCGVHVNDAKYGATLRPVIFREVVFLENIFPNAKAGNPGLLDLTCPHGVQQLVRVY